MTKKKALLIALAVALVSGAASAASTYLATSMYAARYIPVGTSVPIPGNCQVSGSGCTYVSAVDNNLYYTNPLGATTNISAGGSSTPALSYAAAAVAADAKMTISNTVGPLVLDVSSSSNGRALDLQNATASTGGVPIQNSGILRFTAHGWDGAVDHTHVWQLRNVPNGTTANARLTFQAFVDSGTASQWFIHTPNWGTWNQFAGVSSILNGAGTAAAAWDFDCLNGLTGTDLLFQFHAASGAAIFSGDASGKLTITGSIALPANASIAGASSLTNTVALTTTTNVADGATSVAEQHTATTAITLGGFLAQWTNGTNKVFAIQPLSTGTWLWGIGSAGALGVNSGLRLSDANGTILKYSNQSVEINTDVVGVSFHVGGSNLLNVIAGEWQPASDRALLVGDATHRVKRVWTAGTASVAGDYVASAGFGTTASVGTVTGDDTHGRFTVTSSGTGQAANPTVTYTFHDGTWTNAPFCLAHLESTSDTVIDTVQLTQSSTATALTMTYNGTPVATKTYTVAFLCVGG